MNNKEDSKNDTERKTTGRKRTGASSKRVLRCTLREIAQRKARRYEQEFMLRVRDMIDQEIDIHTEVSEGLADYTACEVKKEIMKG